MQEKFSSDYIERLENALSQFIRPFKDIPFPIVIKALSGKEVLSFKPDEPNMKELLGKLSQAASSACEEAYKRGISTRRPNEAGNQIEPFVVASLNKENILAKKPVAKSGRIKTAGYPDIEANYKQYSLYIDCKTYARETIGSSLRTFFLSPSQDPKITKNAFHFLIAYEMERATRGERQVFLPKSWHLYSLYGLLVQVKHEFNASNKSIYGQLKPLAEGSIPS